MWKFYSLFNFIMIFCTNAFSWSWSQIHSASILKIVLNAWLIVARFEINLLNWLTAPKNELSCFKFVGRNLSLIPWDFALTGEMPVRVNLYSSHSMHSCAITHFSAFSSKFTSSRIFITSLTLSKCSCLYLLLQLKCRLYTQIHYLCEVHKFLKVGGHYSEGIISRCKAISSCWFSPDYLKIAMFLC